MPDGCAGGNIIDDDGLVIFIRRDMLYSRCDVSLIMKYCSQWQLKEKDDSDMIEQSGMEVAIRRRNQSPELDLRSPKMAIFGGHTT